MANSQKSGQGHSTQVVNPTILAHFSYRRINPRESSSTLSKRFTHFVGFGTLSPTDFATDSVSFYSRKVVDLISKVRRGLQALREVLAEILKLLPVMLHNRRILCRVVDRAQLPSLVGGRRED